MHTTLQAIGLRLNKSSIQWTCVCKEMWAIWYAVGNTNRVLFLLQWVLSFFFFPFIDIGMNVVIENVVQMDKEVSANGLPDFIFRINQWEDFEYGLQQQRKHEVAYYSNKVPDSKLSKGYWHT